MTKMRNFDFKNGSTGYSHKIDRISHKIDGICPIYFYNKPILPTVKRILPDWLCLPNKLGGGGGGGGLKLKGSKHWENPLGKPRTCWILNVCHDDNRELLEVDHFKFGKCSSNATATLRHGPRFCCY